MGYTLFMLVRPVLIRQSATHEEHVEAQTIVEKYGQSSLSRFTLFNDKSYFFHNESMVTFATKGRIALALGDPIGPEEDMSAALRAFSGFCSRNAWSP